MSYDTNKINLLHNYSSLDDIDSFEIEKNYLFLRSADEIIDQQIQKNIFMWLDDSNIKIDDYDDYVEYLHRYHTDTLTNTDSTYSTLSDIREDYEGLYDKYLECIEKFFNNRIILKSINSAGDYKDTLVLDKAHFYDLFNNFIIQCYIEMKFITISQEDAIKNKRYSDKIFGLMQDRSKYIEDLAKDTEVDKKDKPAEDEIGEVLQLQETILGKYLSEPLLYEDMVNVNGTDIEKALDIELDSEDKDKFCIFNDYAVYKYAKYSTSIKGTGEIYGAKAPDYLFQDFIEFRVKLFIALDNDKGLMDTVSKYIARADSASEDM